jgi:basic amino acid/polyamine antiporter, APA family
MLSGGERKPGAADVAVLGLAAVLGAGLFAVWGPAAAAAGPWLPLSVALAGIVAAVTAAGSAALCRRSAAYLAEETAGTTAGATAGGPDQLGALDAGRPELPAGLARLGGVAFLVGRWCAAAAAAHVFGSYVLPSAALPAALAVIVLTTALAVVGVRWTARGSYSLVGGLTAVLAVVVVIGLIGPEPGVVAASAALPVADPVPAPGGGVLGMICGAAVVCFAFAGIARVAVLAMQSRDPSAALRRAVPIAIIATVGAYLLVAVAVSVALGPARLSEEMAPLAAVVDSGRAPALGVLVRVAAAVAAGSALLSVIAGAGRTASVMARSGELPQALAARGARGNPWLAEVAAGAAAMVVALVAGQVTTIVLSACCMLVGYAVVNLAAARLPSRHCYWPRWTAAAGVVLCLLLAVLLPPWHVLVAVAAIVVGWVAATMFRSRATQ